ncbi:MAG: hypothetical protein LBE56_12165 [Tannerella sp.]|nr:hypothetical protein [Tannerella sp.]
MLNKNITLNRRICIRQGHEPDFAPGQNADARWSPYNVGNSQNMSHASRLFLSIGQTVRPHHGITFLASLRSNPILNYPDCFVTRKDDDNLLK